MHPTLLVGPADWDPVRLPREEFSARIGRLWEAAPTADAAVIYGSPAQHAELAYFTHLTPKLEACMALLARSGEARLLVGGGVNMLPAAKPLTWIEQLLPLREAGKTVSEWARTSSAKRLVLIGGDAMPARLRGAITEQAGTGTEWLDAGAAVRLMMRQKSARELESIKAACATLRHAVAALVDNQVSGAGATAAILAAEHAAIRQGAQDVRTLFSLDHGRTLRPFERLLDAVVDPLQAYIAVRQFGYWAEGFVTAATGSMAGAAGSRDALEAGLALVRPGATRGEIADAIVRSAGNPPPVTREAVVSLGLDLDDHGSGGEPLIAGEVLSLRAGILDKDKGTLVSAVVAVGAQRGEILWQSP